MKKTLFLFLGLMVFLLLPLSCQDDIDHDDSLKKIARMNIEEAKGLFITTENSVNTLFGIKGISLTRSSNGKEDHLYEVIYYDGKGNPINNKVPLHMKDAGDYLLAIFENSIGYDHEIYLVRKKDGKAYEIPKENNPLFSGRNDAMYNTSLNKLTTRFNYMGSEWDYVNIEYDNNNHLYYTTLVCLPSGECPHVLQRVSLTGNGAITFKPLSVEGDKVQGFSVDKQGNVLYGFAGGEWMRYVGADGLVGERIPVVIKAFDVIPVAQCNFAWVGKEGFMALYTFYGEYDESSNEFTTLPENEYYLMRMKDGNFEKSRKIDLPTTGNLPSSYNVFYVDDKIIYSHYQNGVATLVDLSSVESYREIPTSLQATCCINGALYHFDRNTLSLTRINSEDGSTSPVYTLDTSQLNGYRIGYILDVTTTGVLLGAVRLSDNMHVLAKMDMTGGFTVLKSTSAVTPVYTSLSE